MANAQDLTTTGFVATVLSDYGDALSDAQQTAIPGLITAASYEICRMCHRWFAVNTYDDVKAPNRGQPDKGEPDWIELTGFPVVVGTMTRCATGRTVALTVTNTDSATSRALVEFTATGDPDVCLTRTGLTLTRVASGVATTATLAFADYPTVAALSAAIVALGNGWTTQITDSFSTWASVDLYGPLGPMSARQTPGGCQFDVFGDDLYGYNLDLSRGSVYLPSSRSLRTPAGGWYWPTAPEDETLFGGVGNRSAVRVTYQAGFSTIPNNLQLACAEAVKASLARLATDDALQSESAKDYSYNVRSVLPGLPQHARDAINSYRVI